MESFLESSVSVGRKKLDYVLKLELEYRQVSLIPLLLHCCCYCYSSVVRLEVGACEQRPSPSLLEGNRSKNLLTEVSDPRQGLVKEEEVRSRSKHSGVREWLRSVMSEVVD